MGAARLVTASALDVYREVRTDLKQAADTGEITPYWAARLWGGFIKLCDAMVFADNRAKVASLALRDVRDVRNIEETCIAAYISPLTFDLGPDAA